LASEAAVEQQTHNGIQRLQTLEFLGFATPILVLTGTHDLLNSDAHRLQTLMASQPGALKMIEYRNMLHVWPSLPIREARQAMDQILTFMQIGSHQERPQTVGGEDNPPASAPTKISNTFRRR
jgi:acetyl esterase/lipase